MIQLIKNLMCYFGFHHLEFKDEVRNINRTRRKVTCCCSNKMCGYEISKIYKLGKLKSED